MKRSANVLAVFAAVTISAIGVSGVRARGERGVASPAASPAADTLPEEVSANETAAPAKEIPPEEVFMPACEDHLTTLVVKMRASYTHMQIPTVFVHWCMEENYTHRFENEMVCNAYSKLLEEAHVEKLENSTEDGTKYASDIADICKKYYDEEMVAKSDNGAWLWAKSEEVLPKFEEAGKDVNGTEESPLEACSSKIEKIMGRLHNAYTYNQLPATLMNACQGHLKWNSSAHKKGCRSLVTHLMKAYDAEIEENSEKETDGYAGFCKAYKLEASPLLELIELGTSVAPTVSSMRAEAQKRRLRAEGGTAVEATVAANSLINSDAKELLSLLIHRGDPHGEVAHVEAEIEGDAEGALHSVEAEVEGENATLANLSSSTLGNDMPPLDDFLPACLAHTKKLVEDLKDAYTEVQLPTALEHACELDEDVHKFNDKISCKDFADRLVTAHASDDQKAGYTAFCKDYYVHKGGVIGEPKTEEIKEEGKEAVKGSPNRSLYGIIAILAVIVVIVVVGTFTNLKHARA